ncbi:MAG: PAS domain-containing hybrid sensor histidine kinase/response regulator [Pirellulaceae bacterium]
MSWLGSALHLTGRQGEGQEAMLRIILSSIGDAVIATDKEGRVVFMNPVAEKLTGWKLGEAQGQPLEGIFHIVNEETRQPVANPVQKVLAEGTISGLATHTVLIARDSTERPIDDSASPIHDGDTLSGVVLIFRDITQRRKDERAIAEARAFAESIVDTLREPLLVLNGDLRVQSASRPFYRNFQVTPEETEGCLIYDLGNGQWDIPKLRELLQTILPQNTVFNDFEVEHEFPSIGRKTMLLNARRVHGEGDHAGLILLAIEDITERKQAEDAKREAETRYTSLVRNIKDHSIFMTDVEGNITSWNKEAERIIGYSEKEILGRHFSVIFLPDDIEAGVPEDELRIAREEGRAEDERWHRRKDGSRFWALGIVTPRPDGRGKLQGFSKILRDMTDRKLAEQRLEEQSEALKQADRQKDEFLAMLAHELRNPLAPIRSGLDLLAMRGLNLETVPLMQEQVGHMVRLIDDLLDVSRILRGKIQLRKEPVPLAVVIQRAITTVRPLMEAQSHALAVSLPPATIWLRADPVRLNQIVTNLLNNAAKYTPKGGHIQLSVTHEADQAVISVRDDGIGIEPSFLPHVFNVFTQADRSLDRSQGGLGIGLTLVHSLTEMHEGTVEAHSEGLGKGSRFVVRLPITSRPRQEQRQERKVGTTPRRRILVVDDLVVTAKMVGQLLAESAGHEIRLAHDGAAALDVASEFHPEIVLLDIGLPGMDGYEVAKRLRSQPEGKELLIVAVTGYGQESDRRRSAEAGFDEYLVKPPSLDALQKLSSHPKLAARVP